MAAAAAGLFLILVVVFSVGMLSGPPRKRPHSGRVREIYVPENSTANSVEVLEAGMAASTGMAASKGKQVAISFVVETNRDLVKGVDVAKGNKG
jgi:hypothetical protein